MQMRGKSYLRHSPKPEVLRQAFLAFCIAVSIPAFATKGMFQGRVVEGTKHELGKYIYIEGRAGLMRRVNIQSCRVRFDSSIPPSQRVRSASESLHESAQV